ncbi:MAG: LysR family transcriptional regulator [Yersiniaceae bacterium]|nr:LysR family transcriptional regulator [Yersiniaceae bacterium]
MNKTTLEQWALLQRVIDHGSFANAAEAACRSQSSVSYNISLLQQRLGVDLLVPEGRRAVLTPAGAILLAQVRPLLRAFEYVEARAATLRTGRRARLDLLVDTIFPRSRLFPVLRAFQQAHPLTQVHLTEVLNSETERAGERQADLMVLSRRQDLAGRGQWLMNIDFVAVAHADHPLHRLPAPLSEEDLARYPLIRILDREAAHDDPLSPAEFWTFSTVEAAIEAVTYQVGYGWLPEERIAPQLADGSLKILPLGHGERRATPLHLIVRRDITPPDEEVATLIAMFRDGLPE